MMAHYQKLFPHAIHHSSVNVHTVIIRINATAFIKFLALKVRRLFEGGVYSKAEFIANVVTTTVNLWLFKTERN